MNVANLQLEGLVLAVASINRMLADRKIASVEEIEQALARAEASLTAEERSAEELTPSNRDAVCFPIRVLRMANRSQPSGELPSFSELARMVGQTKQPYNDQK